MKNKATSDTVSRILKKFLTFLEIAMLCTALAACFLSVSVISRLPFCYRQQTSAGQPYIEMQDKKIAGRITSIAADDSHLYCCYGKRHVAKVYDFDGNYVSTIAISDQHNKGGTLMVCQEDQGVVLVSEEHSYHFEDGSFVSFDPQGNDSEQRQLRYIESAGNTYTVQDGYVIRQTETGEVSSLGYSSPFLCFMNPHTVSDAIPWLMVCALILQLVNTRLKKDK